MQDNNQVQEIMDSLTADLDKSVQYIKGEYQVIRAGRANPHILDKITVEYYGVNTPLNQMANIAVAEARLITVNVYDLTQIKSIVKALSEADLGVNISDDGRIIRLNFPVLTEDRRKEIAKNVKQILENTKVAVRNSRRDCLDFLKQLKKDSAISEDELANLEKEVQKQVDDCVVTLEKIASEKEKEILTV